MELELPISLEQLAEQRVIIARLEQISGSCFGFVGWFIFEWRVKLVTKTDL